MKKIYILMILFLFTLISCDKNEFLNIDPYDKIVTENVITDFSSFESATKGAYNILQDMYYYGGYFVMLSDVMSDNVQAAYTVFLDIDKYETKADNADAKRVWDKIASLIAQTSIIIRQAENFDFGADQIEANKLIGQLYVTRALAYFDMQRLFAQPYNFTADASHLGVPIVDEDLVGIEIVSPARSTTALVYDKILSDIEKGIDMVDDNNSSVYYFNKNSAKALLARIYLYMENWSEADRLATEVIGGSYSLVSNANYISSWSSDYSTESIFSLVNTATDNPSTNSLPYLYGRPRFNATNDLYNAIGTDDVRKNLIAANKVLKYPAYLTRDNNVPIIRLSEIYLIKAEALAEMGGAQNEENARTAVNAILLRANPTATLYAESGDALKNVIQIERRKELMFEGHRLFDLTRKKKSFTKYSTSAGLPISISYPSNFTILPIPQAEIDNNINITEDQQNQGY